MLVSKLGVVEDLIVPPAAWLSNISTLAIASLLITNRCE
jgi:hypothetical protein